MVGTQAGRASHSYRRAGEYSQALLRKQVSPQELKPEQGSLDADPALSRSSQRAEGKVFLHQLCLTAFSFGGQGGGGEIIAA